jgi:hypothetical protein
MKRSVLLALVVSLCAQARPYRAMITRTAETTPANHVEVGLRYQGFLFGVGSGGPSASPWHQLAVHARWGIIHGLELETQIEGLIEGAPGSTPRPFFGDIPVGLQWTFLDRPKFALGVYGRITFPTGPSFIDELPPTVSDGTWDFEGTFLAEVRPATNFRIMANLGFAYFGWRAAHNFQLPSAIKYGVAATFNVTRRWLLGLEVAGHSFFSARLTPVWTNNQHLVEVIPSVRFEIIPRLVVEAGAGLAVTRDLQQIHVLRILAGFTYEFGAGE